MFQGNDEINKKILLSYTQNTDITLSVCRRTQSDTHAYTYNYGVVHGIMISIVENGHGDLSTNSERDCMHFI